jgi:hypothetical protein
MDEWNDITSERLLELRLKELKDTLTAEEAEELATLFAYLEGEEATRLMPAIDFLQVEQAALRERLQQVQSENEELASLLSRQEQLVSEAHRWLAEFTRRHEALQHQYSLLTGETLAA